MDCEASTDGLPVTRQVSDAHHGLGREPDRSPGRIVGHWRTAPGNAPCRNFHGMDANRELFLFLWGNAYSEHTQKVRGKRASQRLGNS